MEKGEKRKTICMNGFTESVLNLSCTTIEVAVV